MNWTADVDVLAGIQITEVDMADAGMTVIRQERLLDPAEIARLEALPKAERAIMVGRRSRDPGYERLGEMITQGIRRRVESLLDANDIGIDRLLSVKRDAVFVTGPSPARVILQDGTVFKKKNGYTAFARLGRVEVYAVPKRGAFDLKGIPGEKRELHRESTMRMVLDVLGLLELGRIDEAADTLRLFREDYVSRRLPVAFYREFNADSAFAMRGGKKVFLFDGTGGDLDPADLEISHNIHHVIGPLVRALA
jgi:hypothetical protein